MVVAASLATSDLPDDIGLSHAWMRQGLGYRKCWAVLCRFGPFAGCLKACGSWEL